jgi:dipeptidyl aminopeptidase/acylaminoacyl peptidase
MRKGRIARTSLRIRIALGALALAAPTARAADGPQTFGVDDYFRLKKITQVAVSPDGRRVAYVVHAGAMLTYYSDQLSSAEKRSVQTVYLQNLAGSEPAAALDAIADAQALVWTPDSKALAFLSSRGGTAQVWTCDVASGKAAARTESPDAVQSFRLSPDGKSLAYVTRAAKPPSTSLYSQFTSGDRGVVIDSNTLSVYDFVDPANDGARRPSPAVLRIATPGGPPFEASVPGEPGAGADDYHWSSDGRFLSLEYVSSDVPPSLMGGYRTSLGIFDVGAKRFQALAKSSEPDGARPARRFSGGEWVPGQNRLLVRRVTESDPWVSPNHPDWTVADPTADLTDAAPWRPVEIYGATFHPVSASRILLEETREGVRSLFDLTPDGVRRSELVSGPDGSSSLVRFSADFSTAVFVNESLTRPPELYVRTGKAPARRLTDLNGEIARRVAYTAREVSWKSTDGVTVHAWLLEPARAGKGPWPMITHVHGGPGFAYPNSFAPYFEIWPFPLEVQAGSGIAILVPNYRGTQSYGRAFALPKRTDGEPVDDVITGVKQMIADRVADPARLGITGQSHGAWLGPLVMTREKIFRASSFAEGCSNQVILYSLMPGDLNRQVHDPISGLGKSFWDDPSPYLEGSPDMHFQGVRTASLWEAGAQSAAVMMFSYPKAARHFGAPSEFVVYPKTQHNPNLPAIQRESANRNLDWFAFWLKGEEHSGEGKSDQYRRWKQMQAGSAWEKEYAAAGGSRSR